MHKFCASRHPSLACATESLVQTGCSRSLSGLRILKIRADCNRHFPRPSATATESPVANGPTWFGFGLFQSIQQDFQTLELVSLVILLHAVSGWSRPRVWVWVWSPGDGVQMDWASASGSLRQLCFRIQYLTTGGRHVTRHDGKASD